MKLENPFADALLNKRIHPETPDFDLRSIISSMQGIIAARLELIGNKDIEEIAKRFVTIINESNESQS